jgi:DNA mismatch endonuclease (patch repair protein)
MTDVFSKQERSAVMRAVKSKQNKSTELALIKLFKENKIKGWRRNYKISGNPDFVFPKYRIVVFADGCFWHGHDCRNTKPASNQNYWKRKIDKNKERDRQVTEKLLQKKWVVIRIWECDIKKGAQEKIGEIKSEIKKNEGKVT